MLKKVSYRTKLMLVIMPVMIIGLLIVGTTAYFGINSLIEDELSKSMLATTGQAADNINTWLELHLMENETVASSPAAKAVNTDVAPIDAISLNRFKALEAKRMQ